MADKDDHRHFRWTFKLWINLDEEKYDLSIGTQLYELTKHSTFNICLYACTNINRDLIVKK